MTTLISIKSMVTDITLCNRSDYNSLYDFSIRQSVTMIEKY
jgi:hypothetical protein